MRDARIRVSLPLLNVERTRAHTVDANENRDSLAFLVHVLLDLEHAVPNPERELGIVDDPGLTVEAERAFVSRWITNEDRDLRIPGEGAVGLALRALPSCEVVSVPDHEASLQRDIGLTLVRRRHNARGETPFVIDTRGVDDLREGQKIDLGHGWDRRGGGHPARR